MNDAVFYLLDGLFTVGSFIIDKLDWRRRQHNR